MARAHGHDGPGHSHGHGPPSLRPSGKSIGPVADRCEVAFDARIAHPHGGEGDVDEARTADRRRLTFTLGLTGLVLVAEVVGGIVSGSLALLSDAGHMMTDLSAQLLSLLALVFASRPATARRTYGYYRLEILAALGNGVALCGLAGYIIYSAYHRLSAPTEVRTEIMILIATIGLIANLAAAFILHGARSLNVRGAYLHIVSDALASLAVVVGGIVMYLRGSWLIDPILGFVIATTVLVSAYRLVREASDVLLEAVPRDVDLERVRDDVRALGGIEDVHDLHIWTITSGMFALSAHIVVHKDTLAAANDELLTRVKELLHRSHRISHSTLQIESTEYEHVAHIH